MVALQKQATQMAVDMAAMGQHHLLAAHQKLMQAAVAALLMKDLAKPPVGLAVAAMAVLAQQRGLREAQTRAVAAVRAVARKRNTPHTAALAVVMVGLELSSFVIPIRSH